MRTGGHWWSVLISLIAAALNFFFNWQTRKTSRDARRLSRPGGADRRRPSEVFRLAPRARGDRDRRSVSRGEPTAPGLISCAILSAARSAVPRPPTWPHSARAAPRIAAAKRDRRGTARRGRATPAARSAPRARKRTRAIGAARGHEDRRARPISATACRDRVDSAHQRLGLDHRLRPERLVIGDGARRRAFLDGSTDHRERSPELGVWVFWHAPDMGIGLPAR